MVKLCMWTGKLYPWEMIALNGGGVMQEGGIGLMAYIVRAVEIE